MPLFEQEISIPRPPKEASQISHIASSLKEALPPDLLPIRLAITESCSEQYRCEVGVMARTSHPSASEPSALAFQKRPAIKGAEFNVALVIPTGVGAEIGGHAGDAGPIAQLLSAVADRLITHPNVVNASDINELPTNGLYVEGSVLARLLMGTVGLRPIRANRILVALGGGTRQQPFINAAINSVNAACATYGLDCPEIVQVGPGLKLRARFSSSGRAAGRVEGFDELMQALIERKGTYDAVAISSVIDVPHEFHREYFEQDGSMVNPWGGVEAILTHGMSSLLNLPTAHSPMFETEGIANWDPGVVDPRMAAEAVSVSFLQCILKGLIKSPQIACKHEERMHRDTLNAEDVSCLVIPDGCVGVPTLAALEQGIPVIAVKENRNVMRNDLEALPWSRGQLHFVENYCEAAGVLTAMRRGIAVQSLQRPLRRVSVHDVTSTVAHDLFGRRP